MSELKLSDEDWGRVSAERMLSTPVYGLWVPDGGPDGQGSWMVETSALDCDEHPAVFYDRDKAERACKDECEGGLACVVVELRAEDRFATAVRRELEHAYAKHGRDAWSRHELYGVLMEEIDEIWDCIRSDDSTDNLLREMAQVACVLRRYVETGDRYRGPHPPVPVRPDSAGQSGAGKGVDRSRDRLFRTDSRNPNPDTRSKA